MLQTLNTNITRKQGSVYRDLSLGNLGRTNLARVSCVPLQKGIADIFRGVSISIDFKPTGLTLIQTIVSSLDFIYSPASATELRSMIRVNSNNINLLLD